nr:hypothetical protein [Tanacetum cinerariifolium]
RQIHSVAAHYQPVHVDGAAIGAAHAAGPVEAGRGAIVGKLGHEAIIAAGVGGQAAAANGEGRAGVVARHVHAGAAHGQRLYVHARAAIVEQLRPGKAGAAARVGELGHVAGIAQG